MAAGRGGGWLLVDRLGGSHQCQLFLTPPVAPANRKRSPTSCRTAEGYICLLKRAARGFGAMRSGSTGSRSWLRLALIDGRRPAGEPDVRLKAIEDRLDRLAIRPTRSKVCFSRLPRWSLPRSARPRRGASWAICAKTSASVKRRSQEIGIRVRTAQRSRPKYTRRDCSIRSSSRRRRSARREPSRQRDRIRFCKPSALVIFGLPSALSSSPPQRAIVRSTIGTIRRGASGSGPMDLTQQGFAMVAKKQKPKSKGPSSPAQSSSPVRSAVLGTVLNIVATIATFGSVLLCLVVAKHFA